MATYVAICRSRRAQWTDLYIVQAVDRETARQQLNEQYPGVYADITLVPVHPGKLPPISYVDTINSW